MSPLNCWQNDVPRASRGPSRRAAGLDGDVLRSGRLGFPGGRGDAPRGEAPQGPGAVAGGLAAPPSPRRGQPAARHRSFFT